MATKYPWETQEQGQEQPTYRQTMESAARQYLNRPAFKYDLNSDPLYKQYQNQYMRQGRMAMMDTMGQAAANNGGYGTSYGQMAGQQVYNSHIQQLNDRIPELYQIALDRYQNVGSDLLARMNVAGQMLPFDPQEGGGYGYIPQRSQAAENAGNQSGSVNATAAEGLRRGYDAKELMQQMVKNGVSKERARNALKQAQIINQRLAEERY